MAGLIFRPVDFYHSRHPSSFDTDLELDPLGAGVSPTSSPFPMSPAITSNPFAGPSRLPTPPPLTMGELATRFSDQSLRCNGDDAIDPCASSTQNRVTSAPADMGPHAGHGRFQHALPSPPAEDDIMASAVPAHAPAYPQPSPLSHRRGAFSLGGSVAGGITCDAEACAPPCYGYHHHRSARSSLCEQPSYPFLYTPPATGIVVDDDDVEIRMSAASRRRRSTSAMQHALCVEAALEARAVSPPSPGKRRGCRERRRGGECGVSKAIRYRRACLGRRGAVSC